CCGSRGWTAAARVWTRRDRARPAAWRRSPRRRAGRRTSSGRALRAAPAGGDGDPERERGAAAGRALQGQVAAKGACDLAADRQAEPLAAGVAGLQAGELLEDELPLSGGIPGPVFSTSTACQVPGPGAAPPVRSAERTMMRPPSGVYLTAFERTLPRT